MQSTSRIVRRRSTRCRICHQEIPLPMIVSNGLVFCSEHKRQFTARRREGAATAQLSANWGDTLNNWSERPAELDLETKRRKGATHFFFTQPIDDWLLFRRDFPKRVTFRALFQQIRARRTQKTVHLPSGDIFVSSSTFPVKSRKGRASAAMPRSRLGDFLAINMRTQEIRHFVDLNEQEVVDDLRGIRPASGQTEASRFWGDPAPTGWRDRERQAFHQRAAPGHRVLISELVHIARFPIYGPVTHPLDLVLKGAGWEGFGRDALVSVTFSFSSPQYSGPGSNLQISSTSPSQRGGYHLPEDDERHSDIFDFQLFQLHRLSEEQRVQAGAPLIWRGELLLNDKTFTGEVRSWLMPLPLSRFRLQNAEAILSGHACGPTHEELLQVLKGLIEINQQGIILAQYQNEFDAARVEQMNLAQREPNERDKL